jgi:hypothetical protein
MKKYSFLYGFLTAILVVTFMLTGCQNPSPSQPSKPIIEKQGNTQIYSNTKFNFTFNLCNSNDFYLTENFLGATVALRGPLLKDLKHEILISVTVTKLSGTTNLEDLLKNSVTNAQKNLKNFALTSTTSTLIGGIQAKLQSYTYTNTIGDEEWAFNDLLAVFVKDSLLYAIKYEVPDEFHKEYLDCFTSLTSTFKFR